MLKLRLPTNPSQIHNADSMHGGDGLSLSVSGSLQLLHVLDKCLLVHQAGILAITDDTDITEAEFRKALINKIHW